MDSPDQRAFKNVNAKGCPTVDPDTLHEIRLNYRLAKSAENARIVIDQKLVAFVRVYLTNWEPGAEPLEREKASKQARRIIDSIRKDKVAGEDIELAAIMRDMVAGAEPARAVFEHQRKAARKVVEAAVKGLPAWERIGHVRGFSAWGLGTLIGEAGDIGMYSGCRKLYKRLGLAPDACYPKGEKSTGRMIPRHTRGRITGIIADPLLRAQWRGESDDEPAHAIGPYGCVYEGVKARHLQTKTKGHSDKIARRAMVKALIHDVHRAWHGLPLDYREMSPARYAGHGAVDHLSNCLEPSVR